MIKSNAIPFSIQRQCLRTIFCLYSMGVYHADTLKNNIVSMYDNSCTFINGDSIRPSAFFIVSNNDPITTFANKT